MIPPAYAAMPGCAVPSLPELLLRQAHRRIKRAEFERSVLIEVTRRDLDNAFMSVPASLWPIAANCTVPRGTGFEMPPLFRPARNEEP